MRVLVLGASGMLGSAALRVLAADPRYDVWGTVRADDQKRFFVEPLRLRLMSGVDVLDVDALTSIVAQLRPEVVINCVGVVKQLATANDPLVVLPLNSILPHRLAKLCDLLEARVIHISTDCVFSGRRGGYRETDVSDAEDLYGKSKFIGELSGTAHALTLRTSMIGHELNSNRGLVNWFLSSSGRVKGFARAIFSGLTTDEIARVLRDIVLPRPELNGVYHLGGGAIAKLDLLRIIADVYGKDIEIVRDDSFVIDRSLNSERFQAATSYLPPAWPALVAEMHRFHSMAESPA